MGTEYLEAEHAMAAPLSRVGFTLDRVEEDIVYGERAAWALFYRRPDCKLQICWSAREGGVDFMLAPLDAPDEFGLANNSKQWMFLLSLSKLDDGLRTPPVDAPTEVWWAWRKALFEAHFDEAHSALMRTTARHRRDSE